MIKFTPKSITEPKLQVPGWAGDSASTTFQPWTSKVFTDAALSGLELLYPHDDVDVPEVVEPFIKLSDMFFMLELDVEISTPNKTNLLVIPHYRFYTDSEWSTPIPVATSFEADWWPTLHVIFKMPPKGHVTKFHKDEPFAQVIAIDRNSLVEKMTDKELERNQAMKLYIKEAENLITRKWVTPSGHVQNNLYEVLAHIKPKKKYKLFKSNI
jgi:hypothetical protein